MFDKIKQSLMSLQNKLSGQMKRIPPREQVQTPEQVSLAMQRIESGGEYLTEALQSINELVEELETGYESQVQADVQTAVDEMKSGGDWMEKADHEAKLEAAEKRKDTEHQEALQKLKADASKRDERRKAAAETLKDAPAEVIQSLDADFYLAENFEAVLATAQSRLGALKEAGITSERPIKKALTFGPDADEAFDDWLGDMTSVQSAGKGGSKAPIAGGGGDFKKSLGKDDPEIMLRVKTGRGMRLIGI